jgi:acyl carrier protein
MRDEEILALIKEAHHYAEPDKSQVTDAIAFGAMLADLGIASVSAMEMAGYIEDRLSINFSDDEMAVIGSIDGLVKLIRKYAVKETSAPPLKKVGS